MQSIDFTRPADELAPLVLGATLSHGPVRLLLTEVEAYLGTDDPASHAYRGPRGRAATIFGEPGCIYVYLSYGVHLAVNLVCSPVGQASALLLRSGRVVGGLAEARQRRMAVRAEGRVVPDQLLASGPGNLGRVLGLSLADDGAPLGADFVLEPAAPRTDVIRGPRVGSRWRPIGRCGSGWTPTRRSVVTAAVRGRQSSISAASRRTADYCGCHPEPMSVRDFP